MTDPAKLAQHVPAAARLHDGLERLGLQRGDRAATTTTSRSRCRSRRTRTARRSPGRRTNTSSAERRSYALNYPAATTGPVEGDADAPRAPRRRAAGRAGLGLDVQRGRHVDSPAARRARDSRPNDIYEFSYTAKDPTVNGIGFAAVRDFNAFLRYEKADERGTANPMAGDITRIYTEVASQPGRMLNDFRTLGFNQAENGKIVFDGMMQWIAAGRRHQHELPLLAAGTHRAQPPGPAVCRRRVPVRQPVD